MRALVCPKCGSSYEQHPLNPAAHPLCPACRNKVSWDNIRKELATAAKQPTGGISQPAGVGGDVAVAPYTASKRSVFTPRADTARASRVRKNPFGGAGVQHTPATSPLWGSGTGQAFLAGRIDIGSMSNQPVFRLSKQYTESPVPQEQPVAGTEAAVTETAAMPAFSADMPATMQKTAPAFNFNALPLASTADIQNQLGASLGLPAPTPGMIEMPDTCGG